MFQNEKPYIYYMPQRIVKWARTPSNIKWTVIGFWDSLRTAEDMERWKVITETSSAVPLRQSGLGDWDEMSWKVDDRQWSGFWSHSYSPTCPRHQTGKELKQLRWNKVKQHKRLAQSELLISGRTNQIIQHWLRTDAMTLHIIHMAQYGKDTKTLRVSSCGETKHK